MKPIKEKSVDEIEQEIFFHTCIYSDLSWVELSLNKKSVTFAKFRSSNHIYQSINSSYVNIVYDLLKFYFVLCWKGDESGVHLKVSTEIPSYIFTIYDNKIIPWRKFGLVTSYIKSCFIHSLFSYTYLYKVYATHRLDLIQSPAQAISRCKKYIEKK